MAKSKRPPRKHRKPKKRAIRGPIIKVLVIDPAGLTPDYCKNQHLSKPGRDKLLVVNFAADPYWFFFPFDDPNGKHSPFTAGDCVEIAPGDSTVLHLKAGCIPDSYEFCTLPVQPGQPCPSTCADKVEEDDSGDIIIDQ